MKKLLFLSGICLLLQACVADETLDDIASKTASNTSTNYAQNTMIVDLGDSTADIYTYNGKGVTFLEDTDTPSLLYEPSGIPWYESGFTYAYAEAVNKTGWEKNLEYHEAFAKIAFSITNKEKSLHLEIRNIELCNVATEGIFHFPKNATNAGWNIKSQDGNLSFQTDTCVVEYGNSVIFPKTENLPVIPQTTDSWLCYYNPLTDSGSYILLDCRIFNIGDEQAGYQPDKEMPIWSDGDNGFAKVAIPIQLDLKIGINYTIHLTLENGCPWYNIEGIIPQKILHPIMFNPTVNGWSDGENVDVTA